MAVKKLDKRMIKTPKMKEALKSEIDIHKKLKHVNIVRMYADLEDESYIYLVMEYVAKSNLFRKVNKENIPEIFDSDDSVVIFISHL